MVRAKPVRGSAVEISGERDTLWPAACWEIGRRGEVYFSQLEKKILRILVALASLGVHVIEHVSETCNFWYCTVYILACSVKDISASHFLLRSSQDDVSNILFLKVQARYS